MYYYTDNSTFCQYQPTLHPLFFPVTSTEFYPLPAQNKHLIAEVLCERSLVALLAGLELLFDDVEIALDLVDGHHDIQPAKDHQGSQAHCKLRNAGDLNLFSNSSCQKQNDEKRNEGFKSDHKTLPREGDRK